MVLSERRKQELIDQHREFNVDYDWWDGIYDEFISRLWEAGLETSHNHISFEGFALQGSGAQFEMDTHPLLVNLVEAAQTWKIKFLPTYMEDGAIVGGRIIETLNAYADTLLGYFETWLLSPQGKDVLSATLLMNTCTGVYPHSNGMRITIEMDGLDDDDPEPAFAIPADAEGAIRDALRRIADALYDVLENEHTYLTSDEQVWEAIVANELDTPDEDDEENDDVATDETGSQPAGTGDGQSGPALHTGRTGLLHQRSAAVQHGHEPVHQHAAG